MKENTNTQTITEAVAISPTTNDFKNAVLVFLAVANLAILTTWLVIMVSPTYALSIVSLG